MVISTTETPPSARALDDFNQLLAVLRTDDGHNAAIEHPAKLALFAHGDGSLLLLDERLRFHHGVFIGERVKGRQDETTGSPFRGDEAERGKG